MFVRQLLDLYGPQQACHDIAAEVGCARAVCKVENVAMANFTLLAAVGAVLLELPRTVPS